MHPPVCETKSDTIEDHPQNNDSEKRERGEKGERCLQAQQPSPSRPQQQTPLTWQESNDSIIEVAESQRKKLLEARLRRLPHLEEPRDNPVPPPPSILVTQLDPARTIDISTTCSTFKLPPIPPRLDSISDEGIKQHLTDYQTHMHSPSYYPSSSPQFSTTPWSLQCASCNAIIDMDMSAWVVECPHCLALNQTTSLVVTD